MSPRREAEEVEMKRDPEKEKFWREKLAEQKRSGQTIRQFCEQNELGEVQFYYWQRALKGKQPEKKPAGFVELVRPAGASGSSGVKICIDDRVSIVLDRGFDERTLKSALAAVGSKE
jgi:hypothetical protein